MTTSPPEPRMPETLDRAGRTAKRWLDNEEIYGRTGEMWTPLRGDAVDIARALLAAEQRAEEAERERKRLREALRQIADGEPEANHADVEAGVYPMLNRTHEVHLYQRIAERALSRKRDGLYDAPHKAAEEEPGDDEYKRATDHEQGMTP